MSRFTVRLRLMVMETMVCTISVFFNFPSVECSWILAVGRVDKGDKQALFIYPYTHLHCNTKKTTTCNSIYSIYTVLCIYMYGMGNIITKFILTPNEQLCNNNNMCNILIHPTKIAKTIKRHLQCVLHSRAEYTGVSIVPLIFANLFM